ncbi:MAG: hypothetical protein ACTIJY_03350 [Luteimonas sp.]
MIRKAFLLVACMTLAGCATYGYRGGSGDYYYGSPGTTYRHYGAPYGSLGYGRGYGWYGGAGYGVPYGRYDAWNRYPYGYGGGYYRPPPVIVRPVYPGRPGGHRPPARPPHGHSRPDRPGWGDGRPGRPDRPGIGRPDRPDRPGVTRPDRPRPGADGRPPHRGDADRPGRPGGGWGGRPPRGEGQGRPYTRPDGQRPGRPEGRPRPNVQRPPQAAPVSRPPPTRNESRPSPRVERRTTVTPRQVEPI